MKKGLKVFLIVIACIVGLFVVASIIASIATNKAANADEYKLGDDVIKSVKAVVGERDVTAVSTSTKNGVKTKSYTYKSSSVQEDLVSYVEYLRGEGGFSLTADMDLSHVPGTVQLAKESAEEGQVILLYIEYTNFDYALTLQKGEGTFTLN